MCRASEVHGPLAMREGRASVFDEETPGIRWRRFFVGFVIILLALPLSTPVLRGPGRSELRMGCFQWRLRKRKIDGDWKMIR